MADFPRAEYEARIERAQRLMHAADLPVILLTSEPEIRYFTGFRTLFWQSPTRPWFVVLPQSGRPIAIIPEIGAALMRGSDIADIRTWPAPTPDDDGISLLADQLNTYQVIGLMMGHETHLRMPLGDFWKLQDRLKAEWRDATPIIRALRMIKSEAEIALITDICAIASRCFEALPQTVHIGQPLNEVFQNFKMALLGAGAEDVPYLVGGAGTPSYQDVIAPPSSKPLIKGDVLMLDTGASKAGYFCDFDRNYSLGAPSDDLRKAYESLWRATRAGLQQVRPGMPACKLYQIIAEALGAPNSDVGRFGHGLGMQLTEWPSLASWDQTTLEENMVITLEPSIAVRGGGILVTEENIVIRGGECTVLSTVAREDIPVI